MSQLAVRELRAKYGKRTVLFDASVELEAGEIALIVGPNGAGKSTLLRAIYHECSVPSAKTFTYRGHELARTSLRRLIQLGLVYAPQYRNVFNRLSVRDNIRLAIDARFEAGAAKGSLRVIDEIPELHGLLSKRAGQLSGGQRQLLSLAMALCSVPALVLLDEPLAGLDERSTGRVKDIIQLYRRSHGTSFVIAEHRFTKLAPIADRCFAMKLGRTVVELGADDLRDAQRFELALDPVFFS